MIVAARNLSAKALRRLGAAHKPLVRLFKRAGRRREQAAFADEAREVEREIAQVAAGRGPIILGPWLAEVGYEALYWVPFLRWFRDRHRIPADRLVALSRGGVADWYRGIAGRYVEIFDHLAPRELAARNEARQQAHEGGGRKQTSLTALDEEILAIVRREPAMREASVVHPSLLFRLFREVWQGNLPFDFFWTHTDYIALDRPPRPDLPGLPADYIAAKFYTGTAVPDTPASRAALRKLVEQAAAIAPVVALDTGLAVDDHEDYVFGGIPGVISARDWMTARNNLGVQSAIAAHSRFFLGTCGGLAWLTPFFGTPSVAVYADDRQLAVHLFIARQAGRRVGAAELLTLDLRAAGQLGAGLPL